MSVGEAFHNTKWEIIRDLSEQKLSPIQLAQKYNITLGSIGHQLRILEAYGLVKKEKVGNRDKGKPRTLFSLNQDCAYLVSATKGFAEKKMLNLSRYHDTILKIWFVEDSRLHYYLEKFYWKIEDYLCYVKGMAIKISGDNNIKVVILTNLKRDLMKNIKPEMMITNGSNAPVSFYIEFLNEDQLKGFSSIREYYTLYDPSEILSLYKKSFELA